MSSRWPRRGRVERERERERVFDCRLVVDTYGLIWNTKFNECEQVYEAYSKEKKEKEKEKEREGTQMYLAQSYSECALWRVGFTDSPSAMQTATQRSLATQQMARDILRTSEEREREREKEKKGEREREREGRGDRLRVLGGNVMVCEMNMFLAYVHFRREEWVQGGVALRKSWKRLQGSCVCVYACVCVCLCVCVRETIAKI